MKKYAILLIITISVVSFACKSAGQKKSPRGKLGERELLINTSLFIDATRERILGNNERAKELYSFCLQTDPENHAVMYELSRIEADAGNMDEAIKLIKNAIKKDPNNKWYRFHYADILERTGQFVEASSVYRVLSASDPANPELYINEANALIQADKISDALIVFNKLELQIGISEEVSLQKYKMYLYLHQEENALQELLNLSNAFPNEPRYLNMITELYFSIGKLLPAYQTAKRLLEMNPSDTYVHLYLSDYYNAVGEVDKSNDELKLAFQNADLSIDHKISMLLRFYEYGTTENEIVLSYELLDILIQVHPSDAKAYAMYADFLLRDSRGKEAISMWQKSLQFDQSVFSVWEQLMMTMIDFNQFDSLEYTAQNACETFPEQGLAHYFAAYAFLEKEKYLQALRSLETAADFSAGKPELLLHIRIKTAEAYAGLNETENAERLYTSLIDANAEDVQLLISYSYFLSKQTSGLQKASEMINKAIALNSKDPLALATAALIYSKQGLNDKAILIMSEALSFTNEKNYLCFERCGDAMYFLNKKTEACEMWKKAYLLNPSDPTLNLKQNDCEYHP